MDSLPLSSALPGLPLPPLVAALAAVPDFRSRHGRRYTLVAILSLACAAMLCGYTSYSAMAEWSRNYGAALAEKLGFPKGRTPSVGTLHAIFSRLDKAVFERVLGQWTRAVLVQLQSSSSYGDPNALSNALSIDGKTLRSSKKQSASECHLLSAVSHGLGLTMYQHGVDDKTNEIGAMEAVLTALSSLILDGHVITVDALLTQKEIAGSIREKGGIL